MTRCTKYESSFDEIMFTYYRRCLSGDDRVERVRALVRSLGKSHDLKVIAEGVEGEGQFDLLRDEM